jgi:hypothetical protein
MTTAVNGRSQTSAGNGVTTAFVGNFQLKSNASLKVYLLNALADPNSAGALQVEGVDYTISGDISTAGAWSVVMAIAPANGKYLRRWRETSRIQSNDFVPNDGFGSAAQENALDRAALIDEEDDESLGRAIRAPAGEAAIGELPNAATRRGQLLAFTDDAQANPTVASAAALVLTIAGILKAGVGIELTVDAVLGTVTISSTVSGSSEDAWLLEEAVGGGGGSTGAEDVRDVIGTALQGLGCVVTVDDPGNTITIDLTQEATAEIIRDRIAATVLAGLGLTVTNDDPGNTTTLAIDTAAEAERARDTLGAALVGGVGIAVTPNDGADTITIAVVADIQAVVSSATVTPTFADDQVNITALAANLTLANPTGTAVEGHGIVIRIKDDGTPRTIAYGTKYRAIGAAKPTTTVAGKTLYLGMEYNLTDDKWDVFPAQQEV